MKVITSRQNEEIIKIAKLSSAQERKKQQRFVAEGLRTIESFIKNNFQPINIYITENFLQKEQNFIKTLSQKIITIASEPVMQKISQTKSSSGILAIFTIPKPLPPAKLSSGLACVQTNNPGNLGTLIRTAAAMGKKSIVLIDSVCPWSHKVIQASAGTISQVHIFRWSWNELLENKKDLQLAALVVKNGKPLKSLNKEKTLLVVGNEANGLPQEIVNQCNEKITLPMPGGTESLNAAIAGSIALYVLNA